VALHCVGFVAQKLGVVFQLVSKPPQSCGHSHADAIALARAGVTCLAVDPTAQLPGLHAQERSQEADGSDLAEQILEVS